MQGPLNPPPHYYSNSALDRAAIRRRDERWLDERRLAGDARLVLVHEMRIVVEEGAEGPALFAPEARELGLALDHDAVFLGFLDGRPVFFREIEESHELAARALDLREVGPRMGREEAGLAAYARGLAYWHRTHRFCGRCGGRTRSIEAGHARRCEACGASHFPRTDPAVIVLVTHGPHCLLGRSRQFLPNMYSTLAGFVEPGESLEQAVAREVKEEAGVEVAGITYRSSQPWPFPASLMLGFQAGAASLALRIDRDELEDAGWFTRQQLLDEESRPIRLPRADSIARFLVEEWLLEGA